MELLVDSSGRKCEAYCTDLCPLGLFTVASSSYLISISTRKQVAQIRGKPIHVVTGVALIPLSGQQEAEKVIEQSKANLRKTAKATSANLVSDSDTSEEEEEHAEQGYTSGVEHNDSTIPSTPEPPRPELQHRGQKSTSVVEDIFGRKGQYGRFAEKWFSKKGWSAERRRTLGMSANAIGENENSSLEPTTIGTRDERQGSLDAHHTSLEQQEQRDPMNIEKISQQRPSSVADSLLPKLLRTAKMLLSSNSFYFSYEYDITRTIGSDQAKATTVPLHKSLDPLVGHHKIFILMPTKCAPVLVEPPFSFSAY